MGCVIRGFRIEISFRIFSFPRCGSKSSDGHGQMGEIKTVRVRTKITRIQQTSQILVFAFLKYKYGQITDHFHTHKIFFFELTGVHVWNQYSIFKKSSHSTSLG